MSGGPNGGIVYFIRPIGCDGPIKIGCSQSPAGRLETLAAWSPVPLEIIFTMPGDLRLERNIHECFADDHSHREWFRPSPRLLEAIRKLRAGVSIGEAIDLTKRLGRIRSGKLGQRIPEARRPYLSYMARLRHAARRAERLSDSSRRVEPQDAADIMSRWDRSPPVEPTAVEIARLDAIIADPVQHCVPINVRWPSVAVLRQPLPQPAAGEAA